MHSIAWHMQAARAWCGESETSGSLLEQGFHSVHDAGTKEIVLFHPDSMFTKYIIDLVPDDSLEEQIAVERLQVQKAHQMAEQQPCRQLLVWTSCRIICTTCCPFKLLLTCECMHVNVCDCILPLLTICWQFYIDQQAFSCHLVLTLYR